MATELAVIYTDSRGCPRAYGYRRSIESANELAADPDAIRWAAQYGDTQPLRIIRADVYETELLRWYLDKPATSETVADWNEMLECLPPMDWEGGDGWSRFNMSEMTNGPITRQYLRVSTPHGIRAYSKYVSAYDRSTWMNPDDYRA